MGVETTRGGGVTDVTQSGLPGPSVGRDQRMRRSARKLNNRPGRRAILSLAAGAVLWQLAATWIDNTLFFPKLSTIWARFIELVNDGTLQRNLTASFQEYAYGFIVAVSVGVALGVLMAASRFAREVLDPWVSLFNATPVIALSPLFIVIFGIGLSSKIAIVFLVMLFPILLNTFIGLSNTDQELVEAVRSYGANGRQVYTKVKLPMALPTMVGGLRLALSHGLVGVVVSEFFGARNGIGMMIFTSAQTFDSDALFVGVIILGITGVVFTYALLMVERRLAKWRFVQEEGT